MVITRSSRDIPGLRGMPLVITTIFDPAVSSYPLVPVTSESYPTIGPELQHVQSLPLRETFDDIDEHDIGVVAFRHALGQRGAHVAGADDGDLVSHGRWILLSVVQSFGLALAQWAGPVVVGTPRRPRGLV